LIILTTVTLASSNSALPDDGDCTEVCRSCILIDNFNNCNLTSSNSALPDDGDCTEVRRSCILIDNFNNCNFSKLE